MTRQKRCERMFASLERIFAEIIALSEHDEVRLLRWLHEVLALNSEDWAWLKLSEVAFSFGFLGQRKRCLS